MQMSEFGELTRIRATSLLVSLCLTYTALPCHSAGGSKAGDARGDGLLKLLSVGDGRSGHASGKESSSGLPAHVKRHVVLALLDTLAHTTEVCAAMEPMSPSHLSPLPDLHAALKKACVELLGTEAWRLTMVEALRHSLLNIVDVYAPPPALPLSFSPALASVINSRPKAEIKKFDYMEVWWNSGDGGSDSEGPRTDNTYRPSAVCRPRVVLYSASVPGPLRMLLNIDAVLGDTPHSTNSYHIESFEALVREGDAAAPEHVNASHDGAEAPSVVSSVSVSLRPLSTPGRPQVGPQHMKQLVFDLVRNARRGAGGGAAGAAAGACGGSSIVAQSLEHLLLMMKGEPLPPDVGAAGGYPHGGAEERDVTGSIAIPTDVPWFVRLGVLKREGGAQVGSLVSEDWTLLEGSAPEWQYVHTVGHSASLLSPPPPTPPAAALAHAMPNPSPIALPALLLAQGVSQRPGLSDVAVELFPDILRALAVMARPVSGDPARPLGMRVVFSRLVGALRLFLHVPQCMEYFLTEHAEALREMLLVQASQDVWAPLSHTLDDLVSKSAFLCQRIGPDAASLVSALPRSTLMLMAAAPSSALSAARAFSKISAPERESSSVGAAESSRGRDDVIQGGEGRASEARDEIVGKGGGGEAGGGAEAADETEADEKGIDEMLQVLFSNNAMDEHLLAEPMVYQDPRQVTSRVKLSMKTRQDGY